MWQRAATSPRTFAASSDAFHANASAAGSLVLVTIISDLPAIRELIGPVN
jgi:hypothetical protein